MAGALRQQDVRIRARRPKIAQFEAQDSKAYSSKALTDKSLHQLTRWLANCLSISDTSFARETPMESW